MCTKESTKKRTPRQSRDVQNMVIDSMWVVLLFLSGLFKIPSLIPGTEFQLSAPLAICIGKLRGFFRYLAIGIVASLIGLFLGVQTLYNILVAMIYRIAAGLILTIIKNDTLALIIAGPAGTFAARLVLASVLHVPWPPLVMAAVPGMIFTAITAPLLTRLLQRILKPILPNNMKP